VNESPYCCPKCKADSTQSITMLFQTGVQHGISSTAMSGVGFSGGGLGVGLGSASTKSSVSMALTRKYTMPARPSVGGERLVLAWLFLILGVPILFATYSLTGVEDSTVGCSRGLGILLMFVGLILLAIHPGHKRDIAKKQEWWDGRHAYLSKTWVCFRCGHEFQPE